jgi:hypothetical protein
MFDLTLIGTTPEKRCIRHVYWTNSFWTLWPMIAKVKEELGGYWATKQQLGGDLVLRI